MQTPNRIIMPAMVTAFASEEGYMSERLLNFLDARARGGAGLLVLEAALVDSTELTWVNQLRLDDDRFVAGMRIAVQRIHSYGGLAAVQLNHLSKQVVMARVRDRLAVMHDFVNHMSPDRIRQLSERFVGAAQRARAAGFDGIELHGAHGCTFSEFLSRGVNTRADAYGGSVRNRARFLLETLTRIRETLGNDLPVLIRLNAEDNIPNGNTIDETREIAQLLREHGANAIDLTRGFEFLQAHYSISPMLYPPGVLLDHARTLKAECGLPVIVSNRLQDPAWIRRAIAEGFADFVGLARGLIADPELPNKLLGGRPAEIRRCIACNTCIDATERGKPLRCLVNAEAGRETRYPLTPAARAKQVMVVGGGLAGMEAARIAAQRGHQVTLYEQGPVLGGQFRLAYVPPGKEEFQNFVDWLIGEVARLSVKVQLNCTVTPDLMATEKPDAVVIATGAQPAYRSYPGAGSENAVLSFDILRGDVRARGDVVVLGGGLIGLETAEMIAHQGRHVTLVSRRDRLGQNMVRTVRWIVMDRLREYGVTFHLNAQVSEITPDTVMISVPDTVTGGQTTLRLHHDTLVIAGGMESVNQLVEQARELVEEVYSIGDALEPATGVEAVCEGWFAGLSL